MDKERKQRFKEFIDWFNQHIQGDEKGEGQIFFEYLLRSFGNAGIKQVGATCEERVKKKSGRTGFADLVWKPRVVVELKKRKEDLSKHYDQAFEYWLNLVPNRPKYMVLCNFDELWIYDLNTQLHDPVHKLNIQDLPDNWGSLAFLFPKEEEPIFNNNNVEVTKEAADIVGSMFLSLTKRGVEPEIAQRFVLQLVVALFAEDVGLIPQYTLNKILKRALKDPILQSELYDLFISMATSKISDKPKAYQNIDYFNGGLFSEVKTIELTFIELDLLVQASDQDWSKVRPSIFGAIFESSMDQNARHGHGIHYTSELDIQKIINPTIVKPFKDRIDKAKTKTELQKILQELETYKVLDPACGSGNFLYIAYRELVRLEMYLLGKLHEKFSTKKHNYNPDNLKFSVISPKNFYGIDTNQFGLELAKISISIGRKLAVDEFHIQDKVIPFENLDKNFIYSDALKSKWPDVNAIVGNPPFLSSKYLKVEMPVDYVNEIRKIFKDVPGRADYCVYWFRKAHDHLKTGQRAGLVGTNTIRQNYSREGGLDYILANNGTITEAVSTQVWSGDANVHVSIVNWVKGSEDGKKKLFTQTGDKVTSDWDVVELDTINSSLSNNISVTDAEVLEINKKPKMCHVGQAPQSEGFYLDRNTYKTIVDKNKINNEVIFPFLIGREMLSKEGKPKRYVVDFGKMDLIKAKKYKNVFSIVENTVYPDVKEKSRKELKKNKNKPGQWTNHLDKWWHHWRPRQDLIKQIRKLSRYIAISRVTKRPVLQFIDSSINPGDALTVFTFEDDYSFGVLQSIFHTEWFRAKCSTLKGDWRYTGETIFNTFPWPQSPTLNDIKAICDISIELREFRLKVLKENNWGLKDLYQTLEIHGKNELKNIHSRLDTAVKTAYGFKSDEILANLLLLNKEVYNNELNKISIEGPGLPRCVVNKNDYVSKDCLKM